MELYNQGFVPQPIQTNAMYENGIKMAHKPVQQHQLDNEFSPQDFMKDSFEVINVQDGRLYDKDLNPRKLNKRTKALKNESVDTQNSYDGMFEDLGSKTVIRGSADEYQGRQRNGSRSNLASKTNFQPEVIPKGVMLNMNSNTTLRQSPDHRRSRTAMEFEETSQTQDDN